MITPNDIATKDFKKVAVGYSPEEVDTFLDDIYEDLRRRLRRKQRRRQKQMAMPSLTVRSSRQRIFWHPQEQRRMSWNRRFPDWKAVTN